MCDHLARIEREHAEQVAIEMEGEESEILDDVRENERWETHFALIKELLTTNQLGTSKFGASMPSTLGSDSDCLYLSRDSAR